jgi:uncharacterized protein YqeY
MTETTHQQRIESDLKTALKARDKDRVSTLRLLLAEIKNERIRRGEDLDETAFVAVVRRGVKQRHEAAEKYREGGREDSAAKEEREAEILQAYLPRQADETEIRKAVEDFVAQEELSGPGGIGPVMKAMMAKFGGRADGGTLNKIARDVLSGGGSG